MQETAPSMLAGWSNFYVIIGSSAGALTGLMFIVITLIAGRRSRAPNEAIATFNTPTVVHFGAALPISAVLSAPWSSPAQAGALIAVVGVVGVAYVVHVTLRQRRLTIYQPDAEDTVWFAILPFVAYAANVAGGIVLRAVPADALFVLAGAALLLIFVGIHNAWDIVTFIAIDNAGEPPSANPADGAPLPPSAKTEA